MPAMDVHTETVYIFCIQKLHKMYTTDVYKMYTKFKQNVYHVLTNFFIHFVYKIRRTMPAKFCIQNVYKSLSKCGLYFVYKHFVYILYSYILYTKCIQKIVQSWNTFCIILYTSILIYKKRTSWTLCKQFIYKIHTKCIYK